MYDVSKQNHCFGYIVIFCPYIPWRFWCFDTDLFFIVNIVSPPPPFTSYSHPPNDIVQFFFDEPTGLTSSRRWPRKLIYSFGFSCFPSFCFGVFSYRFSSWAVCPRYGRRKVSSSRRRVFRFLTCQSECIVVGSTAVSSLLVSYSIITALCVCV